MNPSKWLLPLIVLSALAAPFHSARAADFKVNPPGVLKDNFGQGAPDYSSYAPGIKFPITGFPTTLNSQVRNKGGGAIGGDQCDAGNYNEVWSDTLCETRGKKNAPPLGCPLNTVHQGVDIRGGTTTTCSTLRSSRQNLIPVVAVKDGVIKAIGSYTVDLWPRDGERYRYLHMNMQGLKVRLNQRVTAGETIGFMYNDFGGTSTTLHLHLEHWKNIAGKGFIPVPLYCDLVTAYERDRGVSAVMLGGGQRCEGSTGTAQPGSGTGTDTGTGPIVGTGPQVQPGETSKISSYWTSNGSEFGLISEGNSRTFVVTTPKAELASSMLPGEKVFYGFKAGEVYLGKARILGDSCGSGEFDATGPVLESGKRVEVTGSRLKAGVGCTSPGPEQVTMAFSFTRKTGEGQTPTTCVGETALNRQSKTELTRNWGALTMYVPWESWNSYIRNWPGLRLGTDNKPVDVQTDAFGGTIMACETDESGVGIWWYWLLVRKGYGANGVAVTQPTLVELAKGIAGSTAAPAVIDNYINAYSQLSERYFGRRLARDEKIPISNADQLWALGQTMFHHESGRTPLIDRETFERGIRFGTDFMQGRFQNVAAYKKVCAEPVVVVPGQQEPGASPQILAEKDARILVLEQTTARLNGMVQDLQERLDRISKLAAE